MTDHLQNTHRLPADLRSLSKLLHVRLHFCHTTLLFWSWNGMKCIFTLSVFRMHVIDLIVNRSTVHVSKLSILVKQQTLLRWCMPDLSNHLICLNPSIFIKLTAKLISTLSASIQSTTKGQNQPSPCPHTSFLIIWCMSQYGRKELSLFLFHYDFHLYQHTFIRNATVESHFQFWLLVM